MLWFPSEMASINPFSYSSTFSDLHLSYSRWIVRKKELELDGMVHRAYNAFFMGSSKSKNKKSLRISIKISFAKVLIEKLWRILELRNQSCIIKYLIFKLIRQVGFFERSDKMTWFWNSSAKKRPSLPRYHHYSFENFPFPCVKISSFFVPNSL